MLPSEDVSSNSTTARPSVEDIRRAISEVTSGVNTRALFDRIDSDVTLSEDDRLTMRQNVINEVLREIFRYHLQMGQRPPDDVRQRMVNTLLLPHVDDVLVNVPNWPSDNNPHSTGGSQLPYEAYERAEAREYLEQSRAEAPGSSRVADDAPQSIPNRVTPGWDDEVVEQPHRIENGEEVPNVPLESIWSASATEVFAQLRAYDALQHDALREHQ